MSRPSTGQAELIEGVCFYQIIDFLDEQTDNIDSNEPSISWCWWNRQCSWRYLRSIVSKPDSNCKASLTSSGLASRVDEARCGIGHGLHDTLALVLSIVGVTTGGIGDFLRGRLAVT